METPKFGSLTPVDLRECWPREDSDFTPWLAQEESIALLGEAIGCTELEVKQQEAAVGRFSADILCRNVADDSLVVIENQLEKTDHSHLGQLITYAAGLDAKTLVWVVKEFTEEHRAAIDWLNLHTDEDFHFFGVEVEVLRIGNSPPAPRFDVVAKPNDWAKVTRQAPRSRTGNSDLQNLYLEFWQIFGDHSEEAGRFKRPKPQPDKWLGWGSGGKETSLCTQICFKENWILVDVYLGGRSCDAHYQLLKSQQEKIEAELGYSLVWDARPGMKSCNIHIKKEVDTKDRSRWGEYSQWLLERLAEFGDVFRPRIKQLDASEWVPATDSREAAVELD